MIAVQELRIGQSAAIGQFDRWVNKTLVQRDN
jgi:hypothetical protein